MNSKKIILFLSTTLLCFSLLAITQNESENENDKVIRAAIDIGMGGPKLQVAEIDIKTNKIIKMLHTQRYFVNFYDSLSKNSSNQLSSEIMIKGRIAFQEAVKKAHSFNPDGIVAIATASFRSAANGMEFANELQNETGIKIHIVDQCLEGKLSFQAILSKIEINNENLIVWDIGGGSIQFITITKDGTCFVDCGNEGAGTFKDYIIENIQNRNINEFTSPNPMTTEDIAHAITRARNISKKVNNIIKEKTNRSNTIVIGVGSVFGHGIADLLANKNPFTIEDLTLVVDSLTGKTDADFGGGDYAFCEGSNAILVLGFMQNLNIQEMKIINVNNADGALIYEPFWQ